MFNKEGRPIKEEWIEYYQMLEAIRKSGVTNMFGAGPYLREFAPELTRDDASKILCNWMANYDELNERFGWQ